MQTKIKKGPNYESYSTHLHAIIQQKQSQDLTQTPPNTPRLKFPTISYLANNSGGGVDSIELFRSKL